MIRFFPERVFSCTFLKCFFFTKEEIYKMLYKTNSPKIALVIPFKKGYNPLLKPVAGYA